MFSRKHKLVEANSKLSSEVESLRKELTKVREHLSKIEKQKDFGGLSPEQKADKILEEKNRFYKCIKAEICPYCGEQLTISFWNSEYISESYYKCPIHGTLYSEME